MRAPAVRRVDPADFDWAAPTGPGAAVRAVVDLAEAADGAAPLDEAALLHLRHHGLAGSTLLVAGDPVAGFAWLRGGSLHVVVAPEARVAGLGTALGQAALAEAGEVSLDAWSHGNHPGAMVLARRLGFDRVRDLWVMRRSLTDLPALDEAGDTDVVVRPFQPGQDEGPFLAVNAKAFAGHPEQGHLDRGDLDERMAEAWFDPAGFFVAHPATQPTDHPGILIGFHWTKVHDGKRPHGEVYVVGVSPEAQGTGLGRLLTLTGLHHLAARGLDEVILYVESDNRPAISTYTRLGFTHAAADTHVMYHRDGVT